jgi:hypothetical protein
MKRALLICAALAMTPVPAAAQTATAHAAAQPQVDGRKVADAVRQLLNRTYVLPELRPKFDAVLAKGLASGRYDVSNSNELVERLNADLHSVTPDKHLNVLYDPERARRLEARPENAEHDDSPPSEEAIRDAVRLNHGIAELKLLPGNVRYMRYNGFIWAGPKTAEALDNAMRFLRDGDAVIIDLRGNGGGSPQAVQYLVSHFLPAKTPIVTFYMGGDPADRLSTLPTLPAGRMVGKPLYVLTSGMSASAAEEFIGHVAGFKIGEVIGANSAGAGFRNDFYPLSDGLVISISVGRAVLASTGKDWEGVGIAPTTRTDVEKALDVAETHAWKRIAQTATGDRKRELEAQAALLAAKIDPVATALPLASYAGTYGERTLTLAANGLQWRRGEGPKLMLIPVGANEFWFDEDPETRVTFSVAGDRVTGFRMVRGDGSVVESTRNP